MQLGGPSSQKSNASKNSEFNEENVLEIVKFERWPSDEPPKKLDVVDVRDNIELFNHIRQLFKDPATTRMQKIKILTLMPLHWSSFKLQSIFGVSKRLVSSSRELIQDKGILGSPNPKRGKKILNFGQLRI